MIFAFIGKKIVLFQLKIRGASKKFKNQPRPLIRPRSVNFRQHFRNLSCNKVPLNIELELESLFGLHVVHSCTHWLRPRNNPTPRRRKEKERAPDPKLRTLFSVFRYSPKEFNKGNFDECNKERARSVRVGKGHSLPPPPGARGIQRHKK